MNVWDERVANLLEFATARPDGFTNEEAMEEFEWSLVTFNKTVQRFRDICGNDDTLTLVCDPATPGEDWVYKLVGNYENARTWLLNRMLDGERRFITVGNVAAVIAKNEDGRTATGKKARIYNATARYVKELIESLGLDEK